MSDAVAMVNSMEEETRRLSSPEREAQLLWYTVRQLAQRIDGLEADRAEFRDALREFVDP